jgi:hypothetical protein
VSNRGAPIETAGTPAEMPIRVNLGRAEKEH